MDETRMFVVRSMQRARAQAFDGEPVAAWRRGVNQSLPPPADEPQEPAVLDAATRAAEMQKMLAQGMRAAAIARALGISAQTVYTARSRAKKEATAAAGAAKKEKDAEAPLSTLPTPCRGYQEQRVFILDWRQRMSRYEFEGEPGQGKPKKSRKRVCAMTASQVREQIGGHTAMHASTINSAPGLARPRATIERPVKPRKTGQEGKFFAGQKGVDLELHWRTACTQA